MNEHPINSIMNTAMNNLKDMIDVNTIIGKAIETQNGMVIVPISKVSFGFGIGGSEFNTSTIEETKRKGLEEETKHSLPFGGGTAVGVNMVPVGFLVISDNSAKMLPVDHCNALDKLLDYVPDLIEKLSDVVRGDRTYTYEFYESSNDERKENSDEE